ILRDDVDCLFLPLHDASRLDAPEEEILDGRARFGSPTLLPRVFRNVGDLRWEGIVHEHVDAWFEGRQDRVAVIDAPVLHLGAVPGLRQARGKDRRNLMLRRSPRGMARRSLTGTGRVPSEAFSA
ncbi:MAG: hypothetical protein ABIO70_06715, partial [Pseudomonadota bacterium]